MTETNMMVDQRPRFGSDDVLRRHISEAQSAAENTPLSPLPTGLTSEMDPPIRVSTAIRAVLPPELAARTALRRADLLVLGSALSPESPDEQIVAYFLAVQAWGYGLSGLGLSRSRAILAHGDAFLSSAREALHLLHDSTHADAAVAAYYHLNNRPGHVRGWGPAFFTKFLTFADPANAGTSTAMHDPALVLDQWIASAVNFLLPADICELRKPDREAPLTRFAAGGWTTPQYAYYIRLARRLAASPTFAAAPYDGRPINVERALFHHFRGVRATQTR